MRSRPPSSPDAPRFLPAKKTGPLVGVVHRMILGRTRNGLNAIRVQGLDELRRDLERDPSGILFAANHSCWWDLFLIHLLSEAIPVDGHGMMEHRNVERFGFFRRIGAYSMDRSSASGIRASLAYTVELLARPRTGVWIFPQGRIESNDVRPLRFENGLRTLVKRAGRLRIVPTALRYDFWQEERPECLVRFGPGFIANDPAEVVARSEAAVTRELDRLREEALPQDASRFETVLRGRESISERYARFAARFRKSSNADLTSTDH